MKVFIFLVLVAGILLANGYAAPIDTTIDSDEVNETIESTADSSSSNLLTNNNNDEEIELTTTTIKPTQITTTTTRRARYTVIQRRRINSLATNQTPTIVSKQRGRITTITPILRTTTTSTTIQPPTTTTTTENLAETSLSDENKVKPQLILQREPIKVIKPINKTYRGSFRKFSVPRPKIGGTPSTRIAVQPIIIKTTTTSTTTTTQAPFIDENRISEKQTEDDDIEEEEEDNNTAGKDVAKIEDEPVVEEVKPTTKVVVKEPTKKVVEKPLRQQRPIESQRQSLKVTKDNDESSKLPTERGKSTTFDNSIRSYSNGPDHYAFSYKTESGHNRDEAVQIDRSGKLVDDEADEGSISAKGSYSFISADGFEYTVTYTADSNGYRPKVNVRKL